MSVLSPKYNVAARYVNYIYVYRRMNASCTVRGRGEEMRSGTEKRCSLNLKTGHPEIIALFFPQ